MPQESVPPGEQVSDRLTGMLTGPEMVAVRWAVAPLHQVDCPLYDQPDATEWEPLALIAVAVVPS